MMPVVGRCTIGVRVAGAFGLCDLLAWGRAPDEWWALVGWHEGGLRHPDGYPAAVYCTGWVRAELVTKWCEQAATGRIARVRLDGLSWPAVYDRRGGHYFGVLDPDVPRPLPAGYARIQFAATC